MERRSRCFSIKYIIIGIFLLLFHVLSIIVIRKKVLNSNCIQKINWSTNKNQSDSIISHKKPLGIDRQDNACYIISTIQSLMNLSEFRSYLSKYSNSSKTVTSSLNDLINQIHDCTDKYANYSIIRRFKKSLSNTFKYLGTNDASNATEFLIDILEHIHKENVDDLFTIKYNQLDNAALSYSGENTYKKSVGYNKIWNICTQNDLLKLLNNGAKISKKNSTIEFSLSRGEIMSYPKYFILNLEMEYVFNNMNSYDILFNEPENIILKEIHTEKYKGSAKTYNKYAINSIVFYSLDNSSHNNNYENEFKYNNDIGHYFCLNKYEGKWYICNDKYVQEINYKTFFSQRYKDSNFINHDGNLCFPNIVILEKIETDKK